MFSRTIRDRFEVIKPFVSPGKDVLDLGCVDSRKAKHTAEQRFEYKANLLHKRLHEINPNIVGLDIDQEGADVLNKQGFQVLVADAEEADLGRKFDVIIAGEIIEHLENPGRFLRNMRRHLKPDGVFIISTPNPFYAAQVWKIWRYGRPSVHEEHTNWQDPTTLSQLLLRAGLSLIDGYWVQPSSKAIKTWKRFLRPYFSQGFLVVAGLPSKQLKPAG